jgi:branched-chain amino acid transport system permease protein
MQIWVNGLLQGVLIGAMGVAFALVYRTARVFHIALGAIGVVAPYVALTLVAAGVPAWVAAVCALVVAATLGVFIEETVHWPLERQRAPSGVHLIASLGAYLVIIQCVALAWGNESRVLRSGVDATWAFAGMTLSHAQLLGPVAALAATLSMFVWLSRANRGIELRALADDPILVALLGRNVRGLRRWVFGLSGALAAMVALAQAWDVGFDPHTGLQAVLIGMVAMIIGGSSSYVGPFIGGILLGVLRAEVVWFGSARWEEAVTFAMLALFLFFRPQGLFARKMRLEDA